MYFILSGVPVDNNILSLSFQRKESKSHDKSPSASHLQKPIKWKDGKYSEYLVYSSSKESNQLTTRQYEKNKEEHNPNGRYSNTSVLEQQHKTLTRRDTSSLKELNKNLNKLLLHQLHKDTLTTNLPSKTNFQASDTGIIPPGFANTERDNHFNRVRNFVNSFLTGKNTNRLPTNFVKGLASFDSRQAISNNFRNGAARIANTPNFRAVQKPNIPSHSSRIQNSMHTHYTKVPPNSFKDHVTGTLMTTSKSTKMSEPVYKTTASFAGHNNAFTRPPKDLSIPRPTQIPDFSMKRSTQSALFDFGSARTKTFTRKPSTTYPQNVTPPSKPLFSYTSKPGFPFSTVSRVPNQIHQHGQDTKADGGKNSIFATKASKVNLQQSSSTKHINTLTTTSPVYFKSPRGQEQYKTTNSVPSFVSSVPTVSSRLTQKPNFVTFDTVQKPTNVATAAPIISHQIKPSAEHVKVALKPKKMVTARTRPTTTAQTPKIKLNNLLHLQGIHILFTNDKPNHTDIAKNPTLHLTASVNSPTGNKKSSTLNDKHADSKKTKQITNIKTSPNDVQFSTMSENKYVGTAMIRNGHLFLVIYPPDGPVQTSQTPNLEQVKKQVATDNNNENTNLPSTQKFQIEHPVELNSNEIHSHSTPYPKPSTIASTTNRVKLISTAAHTSQLQSILVPAITNSIFSSLKPYTQSHSNQAYHQSTSTLKVPVPLEDMHHKHLHQPLKSGTDHDSKKQDKPISKHPKSINLVQTDHILDHAAYHQTSIRPTRHMYESSDAVTDSHKGNIIRENTNKYRHTVKVQANHEKLFGEASEHVIDTSTAGDSKIHVHRDKIQKNVKHFTDHMRDENTITSTMDRQKQVERIDIMPHLQSKGMSTILSGTKEHIDPLTNTHFTPEKLVNIHNDVHSHNEPLKVKGKHVDSYANDPESQTEHVLQVDQMAVDNHIGDHSLHHSHFNSERGHTTQASRKKSKSTRRFSSPWKNIDLASVLPRNPEPSLLGKVAKQKLNVFSFVAKATDPFEKIKRIIKRLKATEASVNETADQSNDETSFNFELTVHSNGNSESLKQNEEDSNGKNDTADDLLALLSSTIHHAAKAYDMEIYKDEVLQKLSDQEANGASNSSFSDHNIFALSHNSSNDLNERNGVDHKNDTKVQVREKYDKYTTGSTVRYTKAAEKPTSSMFTNSFIKSVPYSTKQTHTKENVPSVKFIQGSRPTMSAFQTQTGTIASKALIRTNSKVTNNLERTRKIPSEDRAKLDLRRGLTLPPDLSQILVKPNTTEHDRTRYIRTQIVQDIINTKSAFPTTPKSTLFKAEKQKQQSVDTRQDMIHGLIRNQRFDTRHRVLPTKTNDLFATKQRSRTEIQHEIPISKALYLIKQQASALRSQNSFEDLTKKNKKEGFNNEFNAMLILSIDDILSDHTNLHGALVVSFLAENKNAQVRP